MPLNNAEVAYGNYNISSIGTGRRTATPEDVHNAFEADIKSGAARPNELRTFLEKAQEEGFNLNNLENRCAVVADLVQGRDSQWATQDIQARIETGFGKGEMGRLKSRLAGVSEESLRGQEESLMEEIKRRAAKVLGKTAISGGVGLGLAGAVAVVGGPVTWGLVGGSILGGAAGRAAVEAWRTAFSKEREERQKVNEEYLKHYDKVGALAQEILTLETDSRDDSKPSQFRERISKEIETKYAELISLTNADSLAESEKTLRENEIKWEKRSNWGAAIGAGAVAVHNLVHGISALNRGEGVSLNLDSNHATHVIHKAGENSFNFTGNASDAHQGTYALKEGWSQVGGSLASGGYAAAGELVNNTVSENNVDTEFKKYEENRQEAYNKGDISKYKERMANATPENKVENKENADLNIGDQYLFEPGKVDIELIDKNGNTHSIPVGQTDMWKITGLLDTGFVEIECTAGHNIGTSIEIDRTELSKATKWENEHYTPEQFKKVERYKPYVAYLESVKDSGEVIKWRKNARSLLGLKINQDYEILTLDKDKNSAILVQRNGDGTEVPVDLSDLVSAVIRDVEAKGAETTQQAEKSELEKLYQKFERKFGKEPDGIKMIYFDKPYTYTDGDGNRHKYPEGYYPVKNWDENSKEFELMSKGKVAGTISAEKLLGNAQEVDSMISEELGERHSNNPTEPFFQDREGVYRIDSGQFWSDGGKVYGVLGQRKIDILPKYAKEPPQNMVSVIEIDTGTGRLARGAKQEWVLKDEIAKNWDPLLSI